MKFLIELNFLVDSFAFIVSTCYHRKMKDAWDNYNSALNEFEDDYFTIDDVWARHEARADLFIMLDTAIQVENKKILMIKSPKRIM